MVPNPLTADPDPDCRQGTGCVTVVYVRLLTGALPVAEEPALEMALPLAHLRLCSGGEQEPVLRIYQPARATVAFGRRDTRLPGFPAAVAAARAAGFATVVRAPGGRVVAYTEQALVVDHVGVESHGEGMPIGLTARFDSFGSLYAEALRRLGIDARIGEVPGEYCPGAQSINARGVAKIVGTAQRVVRAAWLFSAVVIISDRERLQRVLTEVHHRLELPFDPESVGAVDHEVPGVGVSAVETSILAGFGARYPLQRSSLTDADIVAAREQVADLRVQPSV